MPFLKNYNFRVTMKATQYQTRLMWSAFNVITFQLRFFQRLLGYLFYYSVNLFVARGDRIKRLFSSIDVTKDASASIVGRLIFCFICTNPYNNSTHTLYLSFNFLNPQKQKNPEGNLTKQLVHSLLSILAISK